jgi:hypothetical protein
VDSECELLATEIIGVGAGGSMILAILYDSFMVIIPPLKWPYNFF